MTHTEKLDWMRAWCDKNGARLELVGSVGMFRDCVGIVCGTGFSEKYPDYEWYDAKYERIDKNGDVWRPDDAYHKHPCVAVLGHGKKAEAQLYEWLCWFDEHGFVVQVGAQSSDNHSISYLLGDRTSARMVKR
jgi:hypothetical protein